MKESIIEILSYEFAIDIVKLCKRLKELNEYEFKNQLFRSGTSIGANVTEAETSFSKKEFIYKLSISLRETRETRFWLRLIKDCEVIEENTINDYLKKTDNIHRIISSIIITTKQKYNL